jgi:hypothetical protein
MEDELKQFVIGGGAGPEGAHEAYELSALYYARNVKMPNAKHPILIYISDEHFHKNVNPELAKLAHVNIDDKISTKKVFEELREKFAVYCIRKPSVIDIGRIRGRGLAIIETNQAWASGLYGCDPMAALKVMEASCERIS